MTWRWPWVSRAHHDATVADHVVLNDAFREAKRIAQHGEQEANRRYDDLLAKYHDLRAVRAEQTARHQAPAGKSKLTQAIRDNARGPDGTIDRRLVGHFRTEANKLLRQGVSEDEVIASLSQWQTTERADQMTADRMADAFDAEAP